MKLHDIAHKLLKEQHDEDDVFAAALLLFHVFRFSHGGKVEYYHEKLDKAKKYYPSFAKSLVEISDDSDLLAKYDVSYSNERHTLQDIIAVYTVLAKYKISCTIAQAEEAVLWAKDPSTNPKVHQPDRDNEHAISNLVDWLQHSGKLHDIQQDLDDEVRSSHGALDLEWADDLLDNWDPPKGAATHFGLKSHCMEAIQLIYDEFVLRLNL